MCYMKTSTQVGVRELRQNLSVHLARVIAGEVLEVTDRGHAVAVLAPIVAGESIVDRLRREGRLIAATTPLLPARPVPDGSISFASTMGSLPPRPHQTFWVEIARRSSSGNLANIPPSPRWHGCRPSTAGGCRARPRHRRLGAPLTGILDRHA